MHALEAHCKWGEAREDRHQTIPKRSALFLFFACKKKKTKKNKYKKIQDQDQRTSSSKVSPNLVEDFLPARRGYGSSSPFLSVPTQSPLEGRFCTALGREL